MIIRVSVPDVSQARVTLDPVSTSTEDGAVTMLSGIVNVAKNNGLKFYCFLATLFLSLQKHHCKEVVVTHSMNYFRVSFVRGETLIKIGLHKLKKFLNKNLFSAGRCSLCTPQRMLLFTNQGFVSLNDYAFCTVCNRKRLRQCRLLSNQLVVVEAVVVSGCVVTSQLSGTQVPLGPRVLFTWSAGDEQTPPDRIEVKFSCSQRRSQSHTHEFPVKTRDL